MPGLHALAPVWVYRPFCLPLVAEGSADALAPAWVFPSVYPWWLKVVLMLLPRRGLVHNFPVVLDYPCSVLEHWQCHVR